MPPEIVKDIVHTWRCTGRGADALQIDRVARQEANDDVFRHVAGTDHQRIGGAVGKRDPAAADGTRRLEGQRAPSQGGYPAGVCVGGRKDNCSGAIPLITLPAPLPPDPLSSAIVFAMVSIS